MFLKQILESKRDEVAQARLCHPLQALISRCADAPPTRGFVAALQVADGRVGLIAEVKKASPSAGVIRADFHPVAIAKEYEAAGADCLSVLTDEKYFQGNLAFLKSIKDAVGLPLLRKDFIIDPYQIYEARDAGADAVLLIVAALEKQHLFDLYALARSIGMDVLVETHTAGEMAIAASIKADLIGINSRDLKSFVTDLAVIEHVAAVAPKSALLVGESGIKTRSDVVRLQKAGVNAILVGESLMRSSSISSSINQLVH